jgi:probable F420-dependent oxidoreductase
MHIGIVFPQTEFGGSASDVRDFAREAEDLGFEHIAAYEHILGVNPNRPGGWDGPYDCTSAFLEPFVLFGHMAAVTNTIGFTTGILVLPQRQTALVAKQAATLDVLSGGRLRLGVGLGWNAVEYEALGEDFHNRGRRIEEQIAVLRQLWTQPLVDWRGEWHSIPNAGLNPLPVQRPIPIWFGGGAEPALRRAARLGDGWMPNQRTPSDALPHLEILRRSLQEAGRPAESFGIDARIPYADGDTHRWQELAHGWAEAGATHLSLNPLGAGFHSPQDHRKAIQRFAAAIPEWDV